MFLFLNGEFHLPGKWSVLSEHKLQIIVPFGRQTVGSLDEQAGWKWMPGSSRLAEAKCMDTCACVAACFHFLYAIYVCVCVSEKALLQVIASSIHSGFKSRLVGKYNFNCMYMSSTITATMFALAALGKQTVWKGLGSSAAGPVFYFLTVSHFTSPCQEIWEKIWMHWDICKVWQYRSIFPTPASNSFSHKSPATTKSKLCSHPSPRLAPSLILRHSRWHKYAIG